jgi:hypothetical protein
MSADPITSPSTNDLVLATSGDDPLTSTAAARHLYGLARRFAASQLVPAHLRGKPDDCFIALIMAREMGENPIIVMQSIYVISGKAGWSASYMIARANRAGVFKRPIGWRVEGTGEAMVVTAYTTTAYGDEVSIAVPFAMAKAEGWTKNDKYRTMPELMLRYRSATMLIRLYAPEVLLGYHTLDEIEDVAASKAPAARRALPAPTLDVEVEYADAVAEPVVAAREPGEDG